MAVAQDQRAPPRGFGVEIEADIANA